MILVYFWVYYAGATATILSVVIRPICYYINRKSHPIIWRASVLFLNLDSPQQELDLWDR